MTTLLIFTILASPGIHARRKGVNIRRSGDAISRSTLLIFMVFRPNPIDESLFFPKAKTLHIPYFLAELLL